MRSYHPAKFAKIWIFLLHPEKFKFSQFLLGDKNATYLCSKIISTLIKLIGYTMLIHTSNGIHIYHLQWFTMLGKPNLEFEIVLTNGVIKTGPGQQLKLQHQSPLALVKSQSPCWSVLDFWKINLEKSSLTKRILILFETEFVLPVLPAKINFKIDFCRLKIQFVELEFSNLIFQNSSTDQQWVNFLRKPEMTG